jgi:hypothetical protein
MNHTFIPLIQHEICSPSATLMNAFEDQQASVIDPTETNLVLCEEELKKIQKFR